MGQVFGYARVSTSEQNPQMQLDTLLEAGCDRILTEMAFARGERPELAHLFDLLRPGDTVIICTKTTGESLSGASRHIAGWTVWPRVNKFVRPLARLANHPSSPALIGRLVG